MLWTVRGAVHLMLSYVFNLVFAARCMVEAELAVLSEEPISSLPPVATSSSSGLWMAKSVF